MLEYRYTKYNKSGVIKHNDLEFLKYLVKHEKSAKHQRIVDNDDKIVYVLVKGLKNELEPELKDFKEILF